MEHAGRARELLRLADCDELSDWLLPIMEHASWHHYSSACIHAYGDGDEIVHWNWTTTNNAPVKFYKTSAPIQPVAPPPVYVPLEAEDTSSPPLGDRK